MVASLTDKPKQWNPKDPGSHQSKNALGNNDTGRPAKGMPTLAKVETGGSIYVQMPTVRKAITISDDSESNKEQEQELKQQPKDQQPVVETDKDKEDGDDDDDDEDNNDEDDEDVDDEDCVSIGSGPSHRVLVWVRT